MKISNVKISNQKRTKLSKKCKLKPQLHRGKKNEKRERPSKLRSMIFQEVDGNDDNHDILGRVVSNHLSFPNKAISDKSYDLLKEIHFDENSKKSKKKSTGDGNLEYRYEQTAFKGVEEVRKKEYKLLLPIKTKDGLVETRTIVKKDVDENISDQEEEGTFDAEEVITDLEETEPISTAELLACREEVLKSRRYTIGILSSGLLEDPELKSMNFTKLLDFMEERNPEVYITVRKLATVSLFEIFKDILPSYPIVQVNQDGVMLKKQTLNLHNFETELLKNYKQYLQKLEKMARILYNNSFSSNVDEKNIQLATLAVNCMCDLLVTHAYFNFTTNLIRFLIPLMDCKLPIIRQAVFESFTQVFKDDKRGDLSLIIVQRLNHYIMSRRHSVRQEVISVLLGLRVDDVDLDKKKEEEKTRKKCISHKHRILSLSRNERKKNKKLEQVEKELRETKAEESKKEKEKVFSKITSVAFTIYFRILKRVPSGEVLSACLEGLAKFSHCINLEFYHDIVNVLSGLLEEGNLDLRERLNCIQTVFVILSGQGSALNIDPHRFYSYLYKDLLNLHVGKRNSEISIIIKTLVQALVKRYKNITHNRLISFVKRMATMALSLHHNEALGILCIIKAIMQLGKANYILLGSDIAVGEGFYIPELKEPEYCCAKSTSLWEVIAMQRHYHSVVQQLAKNISWEVPSTGEGSLSLEIAKLKPEEFHKEFDPAEVAFKPAVVVPKKVAPKLVTKHEFVNDKFGSYINKLCMLSNSL